MRYPIIVSGGNITGTERWILVGVGAALIIAIVGVMIYWWHNG